MAVVEERAGWVDGDYCWRKIFLLSLSPSFPSPLSATGELCTPFLSLPVTSLPAAGCGELTITVVRSMALANAFKFVSVLSPARIKSLHPFLSPSTASSWQSCFPVVKINACCTSSSGPQSWTLLCCKEIWAISNLFYQCIFISWKRIKSKDYDY